MKDLLNAGQVLGREEMKKIMAGSGGSCHAVCEDIARNCYGADYYPGQMYACTRQLRCCYGTCNGVGC